MPGNPDLVNARHIHDRDALTRKRKSAWCADVFRTAHFRFRYSTKEIGIMKYKKAAFSHDKANGYDTADYAMRDGCIAAGEAEVTATLVDVF